MTVSVAFCSLLVSIGFGLAGAAAKLSGNRMLVAIGSTYTTIIRGIPDLVLMLLVFYGGTIGINNFLEWIGSEATIDIQPFAAGVITIGFIYGAYMAETFRGAILSIPKGQMEAAWAFGMGRVQTFLRITMPQMVRYALPGFTNNWLVLVKATALVSIIGLQDMTYLARQAGAATRSTFLYLSFSAVLFLVITSISMLILKKLQAKYSLGTKRGQL